MAISAGEVEATLRLRDELTKKLRGVTAQLKETGVRVEQVGRRVREAGSAFLPFSAAVGAAAVGAFKFGKDFEAAMTRVVTLVGLSTTEVAGLKGQVLELSGRTAKAPQELAEALFVVTSAGLGGAAAMDVLEASAKASAAGLGVTGDIARSVTAAVQAYGAENLSAADATDIMFATVRKGNLAAEDLAGSLGRVIGVASQVGVAFADVGGFIATFTRLGVSAEESVTALRGILATILKPSKQARDAMAEYGISMAGLRSEIEEKGLAGALVGLVEKFKGNEEALSTIVPNIRALSGLLGTAGAQGKQFVEIQEDIRNSLGLVDEGFKIASEDIDFRWNQALADAQRLMVSLFDVFRQSFVGIFESIRPVIGRLQELTDRLKDMSPEARKAASALVGISVLAAPGLLALGTTIQIAGFALQGLSGSAALASKAVRGLAVSMALVTWPVALAAALGAAILTLTGTWDDFGRILSNVGKIIGGALLGKFRAWVDQIKASWQWWGNLVDKVVDALPWLSKVGDAISSIIGKVEQQTRIWADAFDAKEPETLADRVAKLRDSLREVGPVTETEADLIEQLNRQLAESQAAATEAAEAQRLLTEQEKEAAKEIAELAKALAGSDEDLVKLEKAWAKLTPTQKSNTQTLRRVAAAYDDLRDNSGRLSPELEKLWGQWLKQEQALSRVERASAAVSFGDFRFTLAEVNESVLRSLNGFELLRLRVLAIEDPMAAVEEQVRKIEQPFGDVADEANRLAAEAYETGLALQTMGEQGVKPSIDDLERFWREAGLSDEAIARLKANLGDTRQWRTFRDALATAEGILSGINQRWAEMAVIALRTISAIAEAVAKQDWLGAAVAAVTGLGKAVAGLFTDEEQERVNDARDAFLKAAGGLAAYHRELVETLGPQGDFLVKQVLAAKTTEQYERAIAAASAALEEHQRKLDRARELVDSLGPAFNAIASGVNITAENINDLGTIALASFGAMIEAGYSMRAALAANKDGLLTLAEAFIDLGLNIEDAGLKAVLMQAQILDQNPALLAAVDGLGSSMAALGELGLLNVDSFEAMERTGLDMYRRLQREVEILGGTTADALAPMQVFLHEAEQRAKELGIPLDEATQTLIDQSKELGVWKEAGKTANELLLEGLERLVQKMDELIDRLMRVPDVDFDIRGHLQMPEIPGGGIESFQHGSRGIRDFGAGTLALLHDREAVLTEPQLALLEGRESETTQVIDMEDLRMEMAALRREQRASATDLPWVVSRAVRDAMRLTT